MGTVDVSVKVNGKVRTASVQSRLLLSDFLRENLNLPGTHVGCEHGVCGACTVIVDGVTARSCLMFAAQVDGSEIKTVESLGTASKMHPIQEAFWEEHGLQCGFCTPGMLMLAVELFERNPNPTEAECREAISDNLCRCTGYQNIIRAFLNAAARLRGEEPPKFSHGHD
jgi:carbon-monoxide dehydrogenase small subunit